MKHVLPILLFLCSFNVFSQEDKTNLEAINDYKYIIVPEEFDFLKKTDQYDVNSLTKFLFTKYGYNAYFENEELPADYQDDKCLGLIAKVEKAKGGFLNKRLQINLVDCNKETIVSSTIGKSKEKDLKKAYNLALREAFETFQYFKYEYKPSPKVLAKLSSGKEEKKATMLATQQKEEEIERLKQEVAALKKEKENNTNEIRAVVATSSKEKTNKVNNTKEEVLMLYAQPIENGFQVVDSTPKVVMILLETPKQNTFIVKNQNAIVYKEDGFWYLSTNDGESTSLKTLDIKF